MTAGSRSHSNSSSAITTSAIDSVREKLGEPPPPAAEAAPEPADPPEVGARPGGATDDTWLFGAVRATAANVPAVPADAGASRAATASWRSEAAAKGTHGWTPNGSPFVGGATAPSSDASAGSRLVRGAGGLYDFPAPSAAAVVPAVAWFGVAGAIVRAESATAEAVCSRSEAVCSGTEAACSGTGTAVGSPALVAIVDELFTSAAVVVVVGATVPVAATGVGPVVVLGSVVTAVGPVVGLGSVVTAVGSVVVGLGSVVVAVGSVVGGLGSVVVGSVTAVESVVVPSVLEAAVPLATGRSACAAGARQTASNAPSSITLTLRTVGRCGNCVRLWGGILLIT
jgi:hypothetical protein